MQSSRTAIFAILFGLQLIFQHTIARAQDDIAPPEVQLTQTLGDPRLTGKAFSLRILHLTKDELADLAHQWLGITRESVKRAAELNIAVSSAPEPVTVQLRDSLEKQMLERNRLLRKLNLILDEWSAKGAAPEEVLPYRRYGIAVLRSEFQATDLKTISNFFWRWLVSRDGGLRVLVWCLGLIVALIVINVMSLVLARVFRRSLSRRPQISALSREFLSRTAYWTIFALALALLLSSLGINLTPLVAAFGGASFIIGFATQSTLSNLASGILLMTNRPFDIGDRVEIAGVSGTVENMTTVSTVIRDAENRTAIVPNTKVWDSVIVNKGQAEGG